MRTRDLSLDGLRIAGSLAVVWLHTSLLVVMSTPGVDAAAWWLGNVSAALCRWCVPVFVMVSGALLLPDDGSDLGSFYGKRAMRIAPPLFFWTFFYVLVLAQTSPRPLTAEEIGGSIVRGDPYYHLWYLYMLIGLSLATPMLRRFIRTVSRKTLLWSVAFALVFASVQSTASAYSGEPPRTFLTSFLPYVGYYLAGYYLSTRKGGASSAVCWSAAIVCGILLGVVSGELFTAFGPRAWEAMQTYANPAVIIMSLSVFHIGLQYRPRSRSAIQWLPKLGPLTLGIYCLHPFWLLVLSRLGLMSALSHPATGIPLTAAAAFGLSAVSAGVLSGIPFLKATVR